MSDVGGIDNGDNGAKLDRVSGRMAGYGNYLFNLSSADSGYLNAISIIDRENPEQIAFMSHGDEGAYLDCNDTWRGGLIIEEVIMTARHEYAMRKLSPLVSLKDDPIFIDNFEVQGKHLDDCEDSGYELLDELFPSTATLLLSLYETAYNLKQQTGDTTTIRRNRILAAMRARGGLTKEYFEDLGNSLGDGDYTVSISQGSGDIGFLIHTSSPPATKLPAMLRDGPFDVSPYMITVTVTGTAAAPDLEKLYERLKPAWTKWEYTYIP